MKETRDFEEAHKDLDLDAMAFNSIFPKTLIGAKIVDLRYGPDHDGDPTLYYIELDNGIKIGLCICNETGGRLIIDELDRTKPLAEDKFIRFQFHDWPYDYKELIEEYKKENK